jgi:hypothetical protein
MKIVLPDSGEQIATEDNNNTGVHSNCHWPWNKKCISTGLI